MTSEQKNVLTWAAILGATGIVIYKFKDSLFGGGFNPTDLSVISSVWNDGTTPSKKYTYTFHADVAQNIAESIYNEFGAFTTNFVNVFSDFNQCKTQGDVLNVALAFKNISDANLWASLSNGFGLYPLSGLSNSQLKELNDYVNSLPL